MYDLSVIIPVLDGVDTLAELLPQIHSALDPLTIEFEIIVVANSADERTRKLIHQNSGKLISLRTFAYGASLVEAFQESKGESIIVVESDHQDPAGILLDLWGARSTADLIIASRYAVGGSARMPFVRLMLSKLLNIVFSRGLDLRVRDMSSGFRLYKSTLLRKLDLQSIDKDILQESLAKVLMEGYEVREIPFHYRSRSGKIDFRTLVRLGRSYLKTFGRLWRVRNSIASADYDARAYDSLVLPQRYWQRQRYKHIKQMLSHQGKCLDIGCGSSRIMETLPSGSIGLDISMRKLRYARRYGHALVQASIITLPVGAAEYPCVICSQVIEHVPRANVLDELDRVLQPGGLLILGTPDYSKWQWIVIENLYKLLLPQAYADEHITHYNYDELLSEFVERRGYSLEARRYILQGELILGLRKPSPAVENAQRSL